MKKLFAVAALCVLLTPAFAGIDQGIDKGMTHVSLLGGFAVPTTEYGSSSSTNTLDYADVGGTYGVQIMHYLNQNLGLGFEINGTNYGEAEYTDASGTIKTSADKYSFFLAGKFNFAPEAKTRVYIPVGAGFAKYKGIFQQNSGPEVDESNTKPAFYAGLGVESDLNDIFIWGFEARYNHWFMDDKKFADTDYLSDISMLLKIGVKF